MRFVNEAMITFYDLVLQSLITFSKLAGKSNYILIFEPDAEGLIPPHDVPSLPLKTF
jgi:hypothetical protein